MTTGRSRAGKGRCRFSPSHGRERFLIDIGAKDTVVNAKWAEGDGVSSPCTCVLITEGIRCSGLAEGALEFGRLKEREEVENGSV